MLKSDHESLLLDVRQLSRLLSLSRTTVWRAVSSGRLPKPVYISPKTPRWIRVEVEKAIAGLAPGRRPTRSRNTENAS